MNVHFLLYSNCLITKGVSRSIISDLQNGSYVFISNTMALLINELKSSSIEDFCANHPTIPYKKLISKLNVLVRSNLGHFTNNPSLFTPINTNFKSPYLIQDCIIEMSNTVTRHIDKLFNALKTLGCQSLELRAYSYFNFNEIKLYLMACEATRIRSVCLIVQHDEINNKDRYLNLLKSYPIIETIIVHSSGNEENIDLGGQKIIITKNNIESSSCCGIISPDLFIINLPFFLESLKKNTCLNRKVAIDTKGEIKNCPSLKRKYGNIKEDSLIAIVNNVDFKKVWNISKDKVFTCKDCEFRNICSDCRAYLDNINEKPRNCHYNPYTMLYEV